jgi:uncharacterized membrane protein
MLFASRLDHTLLAALIYAAGLAAMWSYSLRSNLVYGFDIATEYQRLNQTVAAGIWHPAHSGDAYGAMLSVTILPTELHFLTGVSPLLVFKVVYPVIGALFPVEIFSLARRILSRRWAFASAAFTIAQASFAQELPAVARQEIALVLFGSLLTVMLSSRFPRPCQWALVALFSASMVVSHYSTTYVAIALIGLAIPLQWAISWFRNARRINGAFIVAFVASLVGAVIWYWPVTRSATGLGQVVQTVQAQGLNLLPARSSGESFIAAYFQTNQATMSAAVYQQLVHAQYVLHVPWVTPLLDAGMPQYALRNSASPHTPIQFHLAYSTLSLGSLISQELVNLLGAIGALTMVLRRKAPVMSRQIGVLGLAAALFLAIIRLSGTLAIFYNQERALLQALGVFAIAFCWSMQSLADWREWLDIGVLAVSAACLAIFITNTNGLANAALGSETAVNLANSGEDYERFYMTTPELASASWLGKEVWPGQLVYADRYAQLPLVAMTGISRGVIDDVTPLTINQHAWVYASSSNIVDERSRALYRNAMTTYVFPSSFLDANFDIVYTDGSSEVFHR